MIDRVTASRLGIAPSTIDNTLYDAFGQRQINTMYTQLNQYHVILEAAAAVPAGSEQAERPLYPGQRVVGRLGAGSVHLVFAPPARPPPARMRPPRPALYTPSPGVLTAAGERAVAEQHRPAAQASANTTTSSTPAMLSAERVHPLRDARPKPLSITHQGQFPSVTVSFNLAPNASLGSAITAIDKVQKDMNMPASLQADFQGTAASFREFAVQRGAADSGRAGDGVHRARRAVRELHPSRSRFSRRCLRPAWARCWR